ncbi:hypothetical protein P8452_61789 [Trifolium repens]|nr:hypothetical protein P8452_61789 [Trifolium repens]
MDVFHVTDQNGNKLTDESVLKYIEQCKDRAKLLFDVVCNLTDMEYVVFHATINTRIDQAYLEFYIRHKDGTPISSEPERQHVIRQGVVERRSCVGVRLELFTEDRQGLLAEVVRTFRENGLNVIMADIATRGDLAANTVYVTDAIGYLLAFQLPQAPATDLVTKSESSSKLFDFDCTGFLQCAAIMEVIYRAIGPTVALFPLMQWTGRAQFVVVIVRNID